MKKLEAVKAIRMYPELAKDMAIGGQLLEIYKYIQRKGDVTATDVEKKLKVSIQHASTLLKKLHERNYTNRTSRPSSSGGIEYVYSAIIDKQEG